MQSIVAHVMDRHRARAAAKSAGATSASSTNALSRAGTMKRYGDVAAGAPAGAEPQP